MVNKVRSPFELSSTLDMIFFQTQNLGKFTFESTSKRVFYSNPTLNLISSFIVKKKHKYAFEFKMEL
jgi:hypothetical protein